MIKETISKFTEEDYKLLAKDIPACPCTRCPSDLSSCCGCPDEFKYKELMKPYKEAGIEEYATKIRLIRSLNDDLRDLKREINSVIGELPDDIVKNKSIKFKSWEVK